MKNDIAKTSIELIIGRMLIESSQDKNGNLDSEKLSYYLSIEQAQAESLALLWVQANLDDAA